LYYSYYPRFHYCRFCKKKTDQYRHHGRESSKNFWRRLAHLPRQFLGFLADPWRCRVCGRFSRW